MKEDKDKIIKSLEAELKEVNFQTNLLRKTFSWTFSQIVDRIILRMFPENSFVRSQYLKSLGHLRNISYAVYGFLYHNQAHLSDKTRQEFERRIKKAFSLGQREKYEKAWNLINFSVDTVSDRFGKRDIKTINAGNYPAKTRIAIIANISLYQCKFYRVDQKIQQLERTGIPYDLFNFSEDMTSFFNVIYRYSSVIFYRVPATFDIIRAITLCKDIGIPTFYDIDDLIFDNKNYPDEYASYCELISKKDYSNLKTGTVYFKKAVSLCDYGIASTIPLLKELEKYVSKKKVFLHRNGLSSEMIDLVNHPKIEHDSTVRIFYGSGTKANKDDFEKLCGKALKKLFDKYGNKIQLTIVGYTKIPPILKKYKNKIKILDVIPEIETYLSFLRDFDINMAMLRPSTFSSCKSEIKWMEAGMFGIPSVVSATENYKDIIKDGIDGFIVSNDEEWFNALDRLISNKSLRVSVGNRAKERILNEYGLKNLSRNLRKIISNPLDNNPVARKRPKIMIVNVFYPPNSDGGATKVVYENVNYLKNKYGNEFDVEVISSFDGKDYPFDTKIYDHEGVRVTSINIPEDHNVDFRITNLRAARIFSDILETRKPDLIHFHCIQRLTASIIKPVIESKIPYIITTHDSFWISKYQFSLNEKDRIKHYDFFNDTKNLTGFDYDGYSKYLLIKEALKNARKVIAVSESFAKLHISLGIKNVIAIPNGISKMPEINKIPSKNGKVRLAHIGGPHQHKGFWLFKKAVEKTSLNNIEIIITDGTIKSGGVRHEKWGNVPVKILGRVPFEQAHRLYEQIDVLVAPSIWPESFGLVSREALNYNTWVIASDRGAIGDDIEIGKNGFVISVNSSKNLERVLKEIDLDPKKYSGPILSKPSIKNIDEQSEEIVRLYKQILKYESN
ncbi:MAG: glycosyltransferase [Candidatus Paceibacterota bacterium]|jgi:glycosyltransferase involved in cell wall biosynthesis